MSRLELNSNFNRIKTLVSEIEQFAPVDNTRGISFRGDLAGLLVVLMVATYENCVKNTLVSYAYSCNDKFGDFTLNRFDRLNSRIAVGDLNYYAKMFGKSTHQSFKRLLSSRKERIQNFTGQNVEESYQLLLVWRHNFAHTGNRITTVEEAVRTHRFAKHVLYSFDDAFNERL